MEEGRRKALQHLLIQEAALPLSGDPSHYTFIALCAAPLSRHRISALFTHLLSFAIALMSRRGNGVGRPSAGRMDIGEDAAAEEWLTGGRQAVAYGVTLFCYYRRMVSGDSMRFRRTTERRARAVLCVCGIWRMKRWLDGRATGT